MPISHPFDVNSLKKGLTPNSFCQSIQLVVKGIKKKCSGFTLIELLIVVVIIAVLSAIGYAVYSGLTRNARDPRRRADIDAIAKAYETGFDGSYHPLTNNSFSAGAMPQDPSKGNYFVWLADDFSGFKVCASLENNPNNICNTPATNCFCKLSAQGKIVSSGAHSSSNDGGLGQGSSSSAPACDPNGTLLNGLVGYWKMDETDWVGANAVKDWKGVNHGTVVGGANVILPSHSQSFPNDLSSAFLNAGNFDGSGYVNAGGMGVSNVLNLTGNQLTISAWFKPDLPPEWGGIFGKGQVYSNSGYEIYFRDTITDPDRHALTFAIRTSSGPKELTVSNFVPTQNQWYHVVTVYDGSTMRMYKNGVQVSTSNYTGNLLDSSSKPALLGAHTPQQHFKGLIDDIRVYDRALSGGSNDSDISRLYNNGLGCVPQ